MPPDRNVRGGWYSEWVREAIAHLATPVDPYLDALAKVAAMFEWPLPRERNEAVCAEAARLIDRVLAPVARGRGAVDVAIGEGTFSLVVGGLPISAFSRLLPSALTASPLHGKRRLVLPVLVPGRLGRALRAGYGTCPQHADGKETFAEYLSAS